MTKSWIKMQPYSIAPIPMRSNTAEGGTDGVTATAGNSGGASGDAWQYVGAGAIKYSNVQSQGALSYQVPNLASAEWVEWSPLPVQNQVLYSRVYMYIGALSTTNYQRYTTTSFYHSNSYSTLINTFLSQSAGTHNVYVQTRDTAGTTVTGTVLVPNNQWVRVESRVDIALAEIEARVWLTPSSTGSPDDTALATGAAMTGFIYIDDVAFGDPETFQSKNGDTWYFDSPAVSNERWLGP